MAKSVEFYRSRCLELASGGPRAAFSMFRVGGQYVNIVADSEQRLAGQVIFWVSDVDQMYRRVFEDGQSPEALRCDAGWVRDISRFVIPTVTS